VKIGIGLPNQVRNLDPAIIPQWPARAEEAGFSTLGVGIGGRADDFVEDSLPVRGRGKRLDSDLQAYRSVWRCEPVGGGPNPAVRAGSRQVPLLFGAMSDAAFRRAAREGDGVIGASLPAELVAPSFDMARRCGRRRAAPSRRGAEELILGPGVADLDEISRLADAVL
jgi:alkanesulfonate monooxygenase SsuD/methylene tetrahydromethanopterin reductase-like flavin-dependent oxidoreductase (luciferase family)